MAGRERFIKNSVFILVVLAVISIGFIPCAMADDTNSQIKNISPSPHYGGGRLDTANAIRSYFHSWGKLTRIYNNKSITFGDKTRNLAPGVQLNSIKIGDYVGVCYNTKKEVVEIEKLQRLP